MQTSTNIRPADAARKHAYLVARADSLRRYIADLEIKIRPIAEHVEYFESQGRTPSPTAVRDLDAYRKLLKGANRDLDNLLFGIGRP